MPPARLIEHGLAAIVASSDDAIVSKDLDGIITSWNQGAERIFGYTAEEAVGRSIRIIIPSERQGEEDMVLSKIRRGEPVAVKRGTHHSRGRAELQHASDPRHAAARCRDH